MKRRIVLLGPPASGKETQAELMQARYQLPITSLGAVLCEELKLGTALGLEAETETSQGKLVPDQLVNSVVKGWLDRHDSGFVSDGYPRSLDQANALGQMLSDRSTPIDVIFWLEADFGTISRRIMCAACGGIIGLGLHVASSSVPCPTCGGPLVRRLDDTPETIDLRLRECSAKTAPLIGYYSERGIHHSVDSTRPPEVVFSSIADILEAA